LKENSKNETQTDKKNPKTARFLASSLPLNERLQRSIDQSFMIDFNYNSNHMEGNTLR